MDIQKKLIGPMTLEERNVLSKLQDMLDAKDIDYDNFDENYLMRFLRARKLDIQKAFTMFTEFLDWRTKENVDDIKNVKLNEINSVQSMIL